MFHLAFFPHLPGKINLLISAVNGNIKFKIHYIHQDAAPFIKTI